MPLFLDPALQGFLLGVSLIVAIGAQNAFVLRQGLARRHVAVVATICAFSDLLLIAAGVAGLGSVIQAVPGVLRLITWVGVAFLTWYAAVAARRMLHPGQLSAAPDQAMGVGRTVATCLAFTWLNPHVYLDTVVLLGGLSGRYAGMARLAYGVGAGTASVLWFYGLGYGARLLAPVFAKPAAWRVLDGIIAAIMALLALKLALG